MSDPRPLRNSQPPRHSKLLPAASEPRERIVAKLAAAVAIIVSCVAVTLAPVHGLEYKVAPGDALWTIASSHGVSVNDIVDANGINDANHIVAGHTLTIPGTSSLVAAQPDDLDTIPTHHRVEAGDTLWAISARYRVPLGALARLNGVGGDAIIRTDQLLALPGTSGDASGPDGALDSTAQTSPRPSTHRVAEGESLWGIANRWRVDLDDLLDHNSMTRRDVLLVGRDLLIPGAGSTPIDTSKLPADLANSTVRLGLVPIFDHWANEYSVPADLLKALAWFESGWNNEKRSSAHAIGIGQILPITAEFVSESLVGESLDPEIPEENIQLSARYLRYLLDEAGSVPLAVASYYQGLTATRQHGIYESSEFYVEGILDLRDSFR